MRLYNKVTVLYWQTVKAQTNLQLAHVQSVDTDMGSCQTLDH